jgi:hypothetical protein
MKATINGVTVEGTPKEIAEFVKLVGETTKANPLRDVTPSPYPYPNGPWRIERPSLEGDVTWCDAGQTIPIRLLTI